MTLIIENVKEEFLPAFRELSKSTRAKMRTKKTEIKTQNKRLKSAIADVENGNTIKCENFEDFKKKVLS